MQSTSVDLMGRIITTLVVTNRVDQGLAARGMIPAAEVRSVTLKNVLVDTGATTLCFPADVISQLGLSLLKQVDVATATGIGKARIFEDAKISLLGREGTFECLELPGGTDPCLETIPCEVPSQRFVPLLGVVPLEALGIQLDLQNQTLKVLPMNPNASYLRI